jgi:fused signal recognition particle receptor
MFESSWIIALLIVVVGTIGALAIRNVLIGAAREPDAAPLPIGEGEPAGVSMLSGLSRTSAALAAGLARVFLKDSSDAERYEALEEALIGADVGVRTTLEIVEGLRASGTGTGSEGELREALRVELLSRMAEDTALINRDEAPLVLLVVGVNGSGKTTTIGKLAHRYKQEGKKVILAAGDTFRAGAIEQLQVWGERVGVPVVAHQEGADPAAVLFDGIRAGISRGMDVVICDTAGRLQAQSQLMDELGKVVRVMDKALPGCPHEVLLVLDATIGQNALSQARAFKDVVGATGIVLTKLDGTARGGVVVAVQSEMGLPVKLIGLGEGMDDLRTFEAAPFVDAMLAHPGGSLHS